MKPGLAALAALALCACAAPPPRGDLAPLFADQLFVKPAQLPSRDEIFAASPAMREYLAGPIARHVRMSGGPLGLVEALRGELRIDYDATETRVAAGTFERRAGNCLSLVIMTAAFARQLGVPVTFRNVYGLDTWSRVGGFAVLSGHVNLELGSGAPQDILVYEHLKGPRALIVDFLPPEEIGHQYAREIGEDTVVAMFFNNRAAEMLVQGDVEGAYWWARAAMQTAPEFLSAYNTLGLIYHHHGNLREAERVLRYAALREPENAQVLTNLIGILDALGRKPEADGLRRKLARLESHPPYYFYEQGLAALERGDLDEAERNFRKELRRMPYESELHFAMALVNLKLGDMGEARRQLTLAWENSTRLKQKNLYAAKLDRLRALQRN